jgi:GNAT superfamily N-acetyltransferase
MKLIGYTSVFATAEHEDITDLAYLRKYRYDNSLGLFKGGVCLGSAALRVKGPDAVTSHVFLKKEHRKKGHGIPLYLHLIFTAKRLGARRLWSDTRLNKFSRRMWSEKLAKLFKVKVSRQTDKCRCCGERSKKERYYIELVGIRKPKL